MLRVIYRKRLTSCVTACGRHQRSSLVAVSALLTTRHCRCRRLVGLPWATAPFRWLQRGCGTVCHQKLGPARHFWHSEGRPSLTFFVSHTADLALSTDGQQTSALSCATVLDVDFVKWPRNCVMIALSWHF